MKSLLFTLLLLPSPLWAMCCSAADNEAASSEFANTVIDAVFDALGFDDDDDD